MMPSDPESLDVFTVWIHDGRMADPVMGEPRDRSIRVRVLSEELDRWKAAARAESMSLSDWLRRLANNAAPPLPAKKRGKR